MNIFETAKIVDKSQVNTDSVDFCELTNDFGINTYTWADPVRLKAYWLQKWLCTDTWVGLALIFLDDEVVGHRYQPARKSDTTYSWISKDCYLKTKAYIQSLVEEKEDDICLMSEESINEFFSPEDKGFKLPYREALLTDVVYYNNTPVPVVRDINYEYKDKWHGVLIKVEGEVIEVIMEDILIPYSVINEEST